MIINLLMLMIPFILPSKRFIAGETTINSIMIAPRRLGRNRESNESQQDTLSFSLSLSLSLPIERSANASINGERILKFLNFIILDSVLIAPAS